MKKLFIITILISGLINAQKIKVKDGEVFLDKNKVALIEKVKIKGRNNYFKVFDLENNHLFNGKLVLEESKFFGNLKQNLYFIIECLEQKDSIGIEDTWFALTEKGITKFLVKNKILTTNGFDSKQLEDVLSNTQSKPKFAREKSEVDEEYIKNLNYLVKRDKSQALFVERLNTKSSYSLIGSRSVTQTKFELFQGKESSNKALIGYAYYEMPEMGRGELIICNSKNVPIGYFDNFKHYTFYPLTELKIKSGNLIRLDKPVECIYQFTQLLVDENKL